MNNNYSVTKCRNVSAMLGCRCDVSAFTLRRSRCRPSKIDERCVDLQRSMCRLSKLDDRCADLRRSMALCRPSKTDDRCNYVATLARNIDSIVVCELRRGFAL